MIFIKFNVLRLYELNPSLYTDVSLYKIWIKLWGVAEEATAFIGEPHLPWWGKIKNSHVHKEEMLAIWRSVFVVLRITDKTIFCMYICSACKILFYIFWYVIWIIIKRAQYHTDRGNRIISLTSKSHNSLFHLEKESSGDWWNRL